MIDKNELKNELKDLAVVKFDISLADYCTFKTGGIASILIEPIVLANIPEILKIIYNLNLKITILGGGSNLLISDNGIDGVVLKISTVDEPFSGIKILENGYISVNASVSKDNFIKFAIDNGYSGIQFTVGVPGVIGGGIFMNAGTFMGTFSDFLISFDVILLNGEEKTIYLSELKSSYRSMGIPEGSVIISGVFKLPKSKASENVAQDVSDILEDRASKHPIEFPSAGSVFKNPEGHSSWKLINDAGLKGKKIGGAMVSEKHTNFIINSGGATSSDIKKLIEFVQFEVYKKFNVKLETEIRMVGDFS